MQEFFFQYGLFLAKLITFFAALVFLLVIISALKQARSKERETIEVEKINDIFDNLKEVMEAEVFSKDELKELRKARKKELKAVEKSRKNSNAVEHPKKKIFVLDFFGDMEASEVDELRETITAVLLIAHPGVDEVLIKLESCGGIVHNYGLGASQLKRIRDKGIKLVVSVDLVAASGGYMMACVANEIITAPFAVLGSIGVLAQLPNFHKALEKLNVEVEQHTAGEHKTTLTMFGKNTDKARAKFQQELEDTHILFKEFVSEMRPQLDINKIATGEHWYGLQAIGLHLADRIITSDDYMMENKDNADIYSVDYVIHETIKDKLNNFLQNAVQKSGELVQNLLAKISQQ